MATIQEIDEALGRYYKSFNKEYDHLFADFCEENGFEEYHVAEDINVNPEDSDLVEFDEDFPFEKTPQNKAEAIHDILAQLYNNPYASISIHNVDLPDSSVYSDIVPIFRKRH